MKNLKTNELRIRVTDNERSMLMYLSEELKMNLSECMRTCLRDKYNSYKLTKEMQDKLTGDELVKMIEIFGKIAKDNTAS